MKDDIAPARNFALKAACFEGSLAVIAVALGWLLHSAPLQTLHFSWSDAGWGAAGVLPPLALLWLCLRCPWRPFAEIVRIIDEVLVPWFDQCSPLELALISALAGLGEELLFRGVIQTIVSQWIGGTPGIWLGLVAAAVLFGLAHAVTATYIVLAGLIGLYLGGIWLTTGNLLVPVIAHGGYDFLALTYFAIVRQRKPSPPTSPEAKG